MLPLYGLGVSRYAETCRMKLNKWNRPPGKELRFLVRRSVCIAAAGLLLSADPRSAGQTQNIRGQSAKEESQNVSTLAREIRHQLADLPFYSGFDFITFALEGRKVTLSGQVVRPSLKKQAEATIRSLEGVATVVNEIEVLPVSPTDNELRRAVYRAIYEDPVLAGYAVQGVPPVHIIVKNGNVTLEGAVKSATDKNLAGTRAGSVQNVAGVKNNLKVQGNQGPQE